MGFVLHLGEANPDERLVHQRIPFFDAVLVGGFVILGDEAQIGAVLFGEGEVEISRMQAQEDEGVAGIVADLETVLGGVERDRCASRPGFIPPGRGVCGGQGQHGCGKEEIF